MKRVLALALAVTSAAATTPAHGFGGEDPTGAPSVGSDPFKPNPNWHHQMITDNALKQAGFTDKKIRQDVWWATDYIDSYLYNPAFWLAGFGQGRMIATAAIRGELKKLHFDDLTDRNEIKAAWRRYLTGTIAGLIWAADNEDVGAARHILGISFHAIQDFYAHSNWVDDPARRDRTWFDGLPPPAQPRPTFPGLPTRPPIPTRDPAARQFLYSGTYETPHETGIHPHGTWSAACTFMMRPAVKPVMDVACMSLSPITQSDNCRTFRRCDDPGGSGRPATVLGVAIPANVFYYDPPGMALDSHWMAKIGVQLRDVSDEELDDAAFPGQLFDTAFELAQLTTEQWLAEIETIMEDYDPAFWKKVKETAGQTDSVARFEDMKNRYFDFLAAGPYPSTNMEQEWYLRVTLTTPNDRHAGTDSDVYLKADDKRFLLDYADNAPLPVRYNDFEQGVTTSYTVGPFNEMPKSLQLTNTKTTAGDIALTAVKALRDRLIEALRSIRDFLRSIIGGDADLVGAGHVAWTADNLATVTTSPRSFQVVIDGDSEGKYELNGTIKLISRAENTWDPSARDRYRIEMVDYKCVRESERDRGTRTDEPFILAVAAGHPGVQKKARNSPAEGVDSGERRGLDLIFDIDVPPKYGSISLALSVMEHDSETQNRRDELLNEFAGEIDEDPVQRAAVISEIGRAVGKDWKLGTIKVFAFSRGAKVQAGQVLNRNYNQWIEAGETATFSWTAEPPTIVVDARTLED